MPLDPQAQAFLDQLAALNAPALNTLSPEDARKTFDMMAELLGMKPEPIAKSEDRMIPGPGGQIPFRIYTPEGSEPFVHKMPEGMIRLT